MSKSNQLIVRMVALVLPAHVQARDAPVRPHALETYDQLKEPRDD